MKPENLVIPANKWQLGYNPITKINEKDSTGMAFGIMRLSAGEVVEQELSFETAFILLSGSCTYVTDNLFLNVERSSIFNEDPSVLHLAKGENYKIICLSDCEFAHVATPNEKNFAPMIFTGENMLESERRGKGILNDTAYRIVRTVFDSRNRENSNFVSFRVEI